MTLHAKHRLILFCLGMMIFNLTVFPLNNYNLDFVYWGFVWLLAAACVKAFTGWPSNVIWSDK